MSACGAYRETNGHIGAIWYRIPRRAGRGAVGDTLARMHSLAPALVSLAIFGIVLWGLARAARRLRRRGGGESLMQPFDEIWHPTAYHARLDVEVQQERPAPSPSPGDRLL